MCSRRVEPLVFAHRGGSRPRENTLAAFSAALHRGGATGLESDVWLTADGIAVLDHDGRFRRGLRRRPVRSLRRAQLPGHVPSLDELYRDCGTDFELALDVCDPGAAEPVLRTAAAHDPAAPSRLWLCHPDPHRAASWRQAHEQVRLVLSSERWRERGEDIRAAALRLAGLGLDAINLPARRVDRETVRAAHEAGLLLWAWGVRDAAAAETLTRLGADAIMGDDVAALKAGVERARRDDR